MDESETRCCLQLHALPGLGDALLTRLLRHYGSPGAVRQSEPKCWRHFGAPAEVITAAEGCFHQGLYGVDVEAQLATLQALGAVVIPVTGPAYPPLLRTVYDPPPLLYVRGDVSSLSQPQLAVVGSRKASPAGLRATRMLGRQLVAAGLHVCSGLALGVDGQAHRAALEAGGRSIAVMATGVDRIYPLRHRTLADSLVGSGALVTEYPPGCKPERFRFPRRNRILSGLSLGVLVVEGALRSGSLITAGAALEQGREVFALPWSMFHQGGRGCLRLIRDGAVLVETIEDILAELGPLFDLQQGLAPGPVEDRENLSPESETLSPGPAAVLPLVGYEAASVDDLVQRSQLPVAQVMAALSELELRGEITRCPGGYIHC